jgi:hypothetical protein
MIRLKGRSFPFRRGRSRDILAAARGVALGAALLLALPPLAELQAAAAFGADAFVEGTEDVPLMPGLVQVAGAGMVFDSPQGRIVEAYAKGTAQSQAVLDFYAQTLPQLGWTALGPAAYRREGETLRLELYPEKDGLTVRFYLAPG